MRFLLDTNVVSESMKPQPNPSVVRWLASVDEDSIFLSVITFSELLYGIDRLPAGHKRKRLDEWLQIELPLRFKGRILPINKVVADACGRLAARHEALRRPIEHRDAFIAATTLIYDLTLVTRNISDFQPTIKAILNPWLE